MNGWVLFDLDGTLTRSEEGIWNGVRYTAEKMGRPVPDAETLRRFIGPPLEWSFREYMGMTPEEARQAQTIYRERYQAVGYLENRVYPGIRAALRALHLLTDTVGDYLVSAFLCQVSAQGIVSVHDDLHVRRHVKCAPQKIHGDVNLSIAVQLVPEQIRHHTVIRFEERKNPYGRCLIDLNHRIVRIQPAADPGIQHKCSRHTHQHVGAGVVADHLSAIRFQRGADQIICRGFPVRSAGDDDFSSHLRSELFQNLRIHLHGKLPCHCHTLFSRDFAGKAECPRQEDRSSRSNSHTLSQTCAIASISQRTPFGSAFTATQERAGFEVKYFS